MNKETPIMNPFAAEIKRLLEGSFTQAKIAQAVGVSQVAVAKWLAGGSLPDPSRIPALVQIGVSREAYEKACLQKIQSKSGDIL